MRDKLLTAVLSCVGGILVGVTIMAITVLPTIKALEVSLVGIQTDVRQLRNDFTKHLDHPVDSPPTGR